jgi:hypothetical protein
MKKREFYKQLYALKMENGMAHKEKCSEEENQIYLQMVKQKQELPNDIWRESDKDGVLLNKFYRVVFEEITKEEFEEYCLLKQSQMLDNLGTIKKCVVFFTVLTVISLVLAGISVLL